MKKEYDFSKGERGKFFHDGAILNLPIYIEQETMARLGDYSSKKGLSVSEIVNEWIKKDIAIVETISGK